MVRSSCTSFPVFGLGRIKEKISHGLVKVMSKPVKDPSIPLCSKVVGR
jgi:hypothetical protein